MRGEFVLADGRVIPNNITTYGGQQVLRAAFQNAALVCYVGLCTGVFTPSLEVQDIFEPPLGVGGYSRIQLTKDATHWENFGSQNGEAWIETQDLVWTASADWSAGFNRLFICFTPTSLTGAVFCLGGVLPDDILPKLGDTFTYKYRIYL